MRNRRKAIGDIRLHHPPPTPPGLIYEYLQGIVLAPLRAEPETARDEVRLEIGSSTIFTQLARSGHAPKESITVACSVVSGLGIYTRRAGSGRYAPPSIRWTVHPGAGRRRTPSTRPVVPRCRVRRHWCAPRPTHATGRLCDRPCPATHETVARDRPWPSGTAYAARLEPSPRNLISRTRFIAAGLARWHSPGTSTVRQRIHEGAALPSPAVLLSARLNRYYDRLRRPPGGHFPAPHRL